MIYSAQPEPSAATGRLKGESGTTSRHETTLAAPADSELEQFDLELAKRIVDRIESRLPGRIQHLTVCTTDNAVVLSGECSTFYSKQLAQHTAMGALEYERLINNIDVRIAK